MSIYYQDDAVTLHHGDCLEVLRTLPDASVDSVVTDPPYGLEFMGKDWDAPWKDSHGNPLRSQQDARATKMGRERGGADPFIGSGIRFGAGLPFQQWCEQWTTECLRVLKPGGHMLAFGGTRTWHRLACAVEDAGFEVRDSIAWMYGSGFPKSLDVSKAIDKAAGAEREVVGLSQFANRGRVPSGSQVDVGRSEDAVITAPATDAAREWQGWGTALKPAFEPVVVARKPLVGTVAQNVTTHGTGALNIDGCRIEGGARPIIISKSEDSTGILNNGLNGSTNGGSTNGGSTTAGRWPANVILDEPQAAALDGQSGEQRDGVAVNRNKNPNAEKPHEVYGGGWLNGSLPDRGYGGAGGASRFFYCAKADQTERPRVNGTAHPTVKPLDLMRWLVRLVTPPGGTVLEPFAGSGTTVEACIVEHFHCIATEREADYLPLVLARIHRRRNPVEAIKLAAEDLGLFDFGDSA